MESDAGGEVTFLDGVRFGSEDPPQVGNVEQSATLPVFLLFPELSHK